MKIYGWKKTTFFISDIFENHTNFVSGKLSAKFQNDSNIWHFQYQILPSDLKIVVCKSMGFDDVHGLTYLIKHEQFERINKRIVFQSFFLKIL